MLPAQLWEPVFGDQDTRFCHRATDSSHPWGGAKELLQLCSFPNSRLVSSSIGGELRS